MTSQPYTPDYLVLADNQDITDTIRRRLIMLRITDERGMQADTLELHLDDRGNDIALPRHGARLNVSIGYKQTSLALMGVYTIDEVEVSGPPDTMVIKGKSADMRGSLKGQQTRAWDNLSLGDIVSTIAGEHGLTPRVDDALAAIKIPHLDQTDESDLHLLTRLGREHDALVNVKGGYLIFIKRAQGKSAAGRQLPAVSLTRQDLSRWRVNLADRGHYNSVKAYYHDTSKAERVPVTVGQGKPVFSIKHNYPSRAAAEHAAAAKYERLARGKATLNVSLPGRQSILAEARLTLAGVRGGVDGAWIITRATHEIGGPGYVTKLDAEVPK